MAKFVIAFVFGCILAVSLSSPITSEEGSSLVQEQAQADYKQHQTTIDKQGHSSSLSNPDYNTNGFTFDNKDKNHRDRGYGFEKAYAYSRETAFFDFDDDKGSLNARDIVEKYGKEEDLTKNIPK
ncbi:uncharacterized protein CDAR_127111 [Caerostris darwini]|uniref:Uncharacterized protein n=1 Tax=Caerostris darwini TaxID=1538125 RepID=A0AAV4X7V7_9ARAC|nr:uncharacterized protein CDAR_127111 [Caerostris darwini]